MNSIIEKNMFLESIDRGLNYLSAHWLIGVFSGFGSWGLLNIGSFFRSPENLETVGIFGIWGGGVVCGLTVLLKLMEFVEKLINKFKKK